MRPEAQRIAIAEAMGWVWYRMPEHPSDTRRYRCLFHPSIHEYEGQLPKWLVRADGTEGICNMDYMAQQGHVLDYLNDLNAMHEAEKVLTQQQRTAYIFRLQTMMGGQSFGENYFATATQRAEAFLRVTGLWQEKALAKAELGEGK